MATVGGFDVESGERIFVPGGDNEAFAEDLAQTREWSELKARFELAAETDGQIEDDGEVRPATGLDVLNLILGTIRGARTLSAVQTTIRTIVAAGGLTRFGNLVPRVVEQPVVEPEVRKDKNGRPLSESQLRWSEYRQFSETHSSRECKNRAKEDAGFAAFMRTNLRREMTEGGVGDAVENLNARPEEPKTKVTPELIHFVAEYNRSSSEQVRKLKRADFNPLGYELYNRNLETAIAAGLI